MIKCNRCDKLFSYFSDFDRHRNRKNKCKILSGKDPIFECSKCNRTFSTKASLNRHIIQSCDNLIVKVNIITETTQNNDNDTNSDNIKNNINDSYDNNYNNINRLKCKYCLKKFSRTDSLKRHIELYCKTKFSEEKQKDDTIKMLEYEKNLYIKEREEHNTQVNELLNNLKDKLFNIENEKIKKINDLTKEIYDIKNKKLNSYPKNDNIDYNFINKIIDNRYIESQLSIYNKDDNIITDNDLSKKYKCYDCSFSCDTIKKIEEHFKLSCIPYEKYRNIFDLDSNTFGKNIYKTNTSGDLYIIQTNHKTSLYKIGQTDNLKRRLSQFRTGNGYEPIILYYYPVKYVEEAEKIIKYILSPVNTAGEFYKINLESLRNIIKYILKRIYTDNILEFSPKIKYGDVNECNVCDILFKTKELYQKHMMHCNKINKHIHHSKATRCAYCFNEYEKGDIIMNHQLYTCNDMKIFIENQTKKDDSLYSDFIQKIKKDIYYELISINKNQRQDMVYEIYTKCIINMKNKLKLIIYNNISLPTYKNISENLLDELSTDILNVIKSIKYIEYIPNYISENTDNMCNYCFKQYTDNIKLFYHMTKCNMKNIIIEHENKENALYKMIIDDIKSDISNKLYISTKFK